MHEVEGEQPQDEDLLEVVMNPAFDPVCLQSKVHISYSTIVHVVLVKDIIETLIVIQVEQDDSTTCLHADLDLVDITADLRKASVATHHNNVKTSL